MTNQAKSISTPWVPVSSNDPDIRAMDEFEEVDGEERFSGSNSDAGREEDISDLPSPPKHRQGRGKKHAASKKNRKNWAKSPTPRIWDMVSIADQTDICIEAQVYKWMLGKMFLIPSWDDRIH